MAAEVAVEAAEVAEDAVGTMHRCVQCLEVFCMYCPNLLFPLSLCQVTCLLLLPLP
jgi:hypothetical protein